MINMVIFHSDFDVDLWKKYEKCIKLKPWPIENIEIVNLLIKNGWIFPVRKLLNDQKVTTE